MEQSVSLQPKSLRDKRTHYCPGCGHGIVHRLICEAIDELGIQDKTIGIAPVGCAVVAYEYWDFDVTEAAHGRGPAVATAIKRLLPDRVVFTYQGDGDLAAIGTSEIIHAASRGEKLSCFFVNNTVYGMTNGQMAPTTISGQKTATSLQGRDPKVHGYPLHISEMLAFLPGVVYVERVSVHDPVHVIKAKKAILTAFQNQIENKGFSLVEILSPCPTYLDMPALKALEYIKETLLKVYPLGVLKHTV